jgi:pyruvate/2-oxoglutarate dehydrogenase complex dihydrolipoamide dehydrogenase (E3) component
MYAAVTAAERGHQVTLLEQGDALGGQLWFTEVDTDKESLKRFKDSLIARCAYEKVEVRLNTRATRAVLEQLQPDAVICAVGAHPFVPPIQGVEYATHAVEAYKDIAQLKGKKVVIIGGGAIGCESGYFFASECGATVQILEARDEMCKDSYPSQRAALLPRMDKAGMILNTGVTVNAIHQGEDPENLLVEFTDSQGETHLTPAERVYYCCGSRSNEDMVRELEGVCPRFVVTGDAKRARTVKEATYEGFCAAMDIL